MKLFFGLIGAAAAAKHCLVLTDVHQSEWQSDYSEFLFYIHSACENSATLKYASDASIRLDQFGTYTYTDLIYVIKNPHAFSFSRKDDPAMLAEISTAYRQTFHELQAANQVSANRQAGGVSLSDVIAFFDDAVDLTADPTVQNNKSGHNVMLFIQGGGKAPSEDLAALLAQFGFKLWEREIVDWFAQNSSTIHSAPASIAEPWIELVSGSLPGPISYKGAPIGISTENRNVFSALRASATASHPLTDSQGSLLSLAGAHQSINGARAFATGSLEAFSHKYLSIAETGENLISHPNSEWTKRILGWGLGNDHLVRAVKLFHHKIGETTTPRMYKERDNLIVTIKLEEKISGWWTPFKANDFQLEYVMLDPYIRETMKFDESDQLHKIRLTAPDVNGIFKFRMLHERMGYNSIHVEQVATIRTPKHNDGERFLFCAYPYYLSCFATLLLVVAFSVLFLNHREEKEISKKNE